MLKPTNYADLFDKLYPLNQLVGIASDSQINVPELNNRFGVIRTNQHSIMKALNGIALASGDSRFIRDLVLPYHEIIASSTFKYTQEQIQGRIFRDGFDAAGESLNLNGTYVIFPMNDLGG